MKTKHTLSESEIRCAITLYMNEVKKVKAEDKNVIFTVNNKTYVIEAEIVESQSLREMTQSMTL